MSTPCLNDRERAARRAMIRAHHPDRGGDPDRFVRLLDAFDRGRTGPGTVPTTVGVPSRRGVRRRRLALTLRRRLPRWVPGARRYGNY